MQALVSRRQVGASHWPIQVKWLERQWEIILGGFILGLMIFLSVTAPWIAPAPPNQQDISRRLIPPAWGRGGSAGNLLGTDQIGRDLLSRMIYGARVSLLLSGVAGLSAGALGTSLGLLAAFKRGRWDAIISGAMDGQLSLPLVLVALTVVAAFGVSLVNLLVVLTVTTWVAFARIVRGRVLELKEQEFVTAAYAIGAAEFRIIRCHIFPHVLPLVVAIGTVQVGRIVLMESALSFLGLGVPPSIPSWGEMLSEGRQYIRTAPWLTTLPGLAILILVLSFNFAGRWIANQLDPHLR